MAVDDAVIRAFAEHCRHDDGLTGSALCVIHRGEVLVDEVAGPWTRATIAPVASAGKPFTAAVVAGLVADGVLDLDEPVSTWWPELRAAKESPLPLRWLLAHRAGLPGLSTPLTYDELAAWEPVVRALEAQEPWWEPGTDAGYHAVTYGFLVGEVVRRATGRTLADHVRELAGPLDVRLVLDDAERSRLALPPIAARPAVEVPDPVVRATLDLVTAIFHPTDLADMSRWENPSAGYASARGLAGFWDGLLPGRPAWEAWAPMWQPQWSGTDRVLGLQACWGLGVQLQGQLAPLIPATGFGHAGIGGSIAFADPARELAVAFVTTDNRPGPGGFGDPRTTAIVEALARLR